MDATQATTTDDAVRAGEARRFLIGLAVIGAVALVLRVVYVLVVKDFRLTADQPYYHQQADVLASGHGFNDALGKPAATHPPVTTLVLSIASRVASGTSILEQRLTFAVLGVLTVVVIALIVRDLAGPRAGLTAAGVAAVAPTLWGYDALPMSESPAALLVALTLWFAYKHLRQPHWRWAAAIGLTCGLAMLTRGELALLVPFVALPALLVPKPATVAQRVSRLAIAGVVATVVVVPWVGYNLSRFEKPVYLSAGAAGAFCGANSKGAYSGSKIGLWVPDLVSCPIPRHPKDQSVVADAWTQGGLDYLTAHADRLPIVVLARLGRAWEVFKPGQTVEYHIDEAIPSGTAWAQYGAYWLLLPLSIAGIWVLRRRQIAVFPILGLIAVAGVATAAFYGIIRLRLAADVAFVVLAGVGVDALWESRTARRQDARASASSR
jgi:4-amino-4-deoxy-L-arabinose transferase-like glycosyltransferase